jgi:hydroxypyruvate reductase
MDRPEILVYYPAAPLSLPDFARHFDIHVLPRKGEGDWDAVLNRAAPRVRGLVTATMPGADAALIDALPKLEIIANSGSHVDRVDVAAARRRGIKVTNTPGLSKGDVADYAIGLMLAVAREVTWGDQYARRRDWLYRGAMRLTTRVNGKKLGILGLGIIGSVVARRAQAFDMDISYFGRSPKPDVPYRHYDNLIRMAEDVDFLICTMRSCPETYRIIDRAVLEALGPQGILINIARRTVDEAALYDVLKSRRLFAAGMDVFEHEPLVPENLYALDNLVITPHIGSETRETRQAMVDMAIANLLAHFAGRPLPNPVGDDPH